jgi:hypothetical protein
VSRPCLYSALVAVLVCAHLTVAQPDHLTAPPRTNAAIVISVLDLQASRVVAVAEAMPEGKYAFVPTNGIFTSVRSFSSQLKHIAADLYLDGGAILGDSLRGNVVGEDGDSTVRSKAEIIEYVKGAFAYMRRAAATIDDTNALVERPRWLPYGPPAQARLRLAITDLAHTDDHYGQLVEYLRMNRIVPPGSKP